MPVLSLPLSFTNSFWSTDLRTGLNLRSAAESQLAAVLAHPAPIPPSGFGADDGASLLMAFRGLQAESANQAKVHENVANELNTLVISPFSEWAQGYKDRIKHTKSTVFDSWLRNYEQAQADAQKLKQQYLAKTRRADDAEDDLLPNSAGVSDKYTSSPRLAPVDVRLHDIQRKGTSANDSPDDPAPKMDKGKGKAVEADEVASPMPLSPVAPAKPIVLGGMTFTLAAVSQMLARAASELPLRPVRFPLLGEYQDTFTGEEFVTWLQEGVKEHGLLRRLGEFGNQFQGSDDAFYQFRPKAFDLEGRKTLERRSSSSIKGLQADNILKHTNNIVNMVTKALNTNPNGDPTHIRARNEADEADKTYRIAVRKLDRHRLALEERLEETLKTLQKWEAERLRAIKTVLLQYQDSDLTALIERYRTGPFRPTAQIYESVSHDEADVVFGIDLRRWAEGGWHELTTGEDKKELIPPVAYQQLPNDLEKRRSWIYEVPLPPVHQLHEVLNAVQPGQPFSTDLFKGFDAPVIASTLKLWLLELDPPLVVYESWDDFRKIYPIVGSKTEGEVTEEQRIQNVCAALQKLPRVHLYVMDALIKHLNELVDSTAIPEETDEVYITKLALSLGRAVIRPKQETELSIQDRHPALLFIDLMSNYEEILPPTIAKKKHESERKVPIRKRTAPVDMRLSRSRISVGADAKQLLAAQQVAQNPSLSRIKSPPLPSPPSLPKQETLRPAESIGGSKPFIAPPPPPPVSNQAKAPSPRVPPPPPLPTSTVASPNERAPPRPAFKEPPPELDDLPARPTFKEPPPEDDEYTPPPMPKFVDPPTEQVHDIPSAPQSKPAPPVTNIIPPSNDTGRTTPSNASVTSRSPSPTSEDVRSGSAQSNGGGNIRGPRLARGPARRGGAVASAIANLSRGGGSGPPGPGNTGSSSPTSKRFSTGSPIRRPSSVLGRSSAALSRKMTSDAEDDPFEKK
ncbi:hypothetical protein F5887DRAFT_953662 [Amanita rubescens]|nr:hypothetical protein F5887DRAFT_953662 [Amanita rubescens]